jgi:hypothetical protein
MDPQDQFCQDPDCPAWGQLGLGDIQGIGPALAILRRPAPKYPRAARTLARFEALIRRETAKTPRLYRPPDEGRGLTHPRSLAAPGGQVYRPNG